MFSRRKKRVGQDEAGIDRGEDFGRAKVADFMAKMPFASAIPSTGGSKHAAANVGITGTVVTEDTDGDAPLAPILVVSTTTAEEDAKWRAPLA